MLKKTSILALFVLSMSAISASAHATCSFDDARRVVVDRVHNFGSAGPAPQAVTAVEGNIFGVPTHPELPPQGDDWFSGGTTYVVCFTAIVESKEGKKARLVGVGRVDDQTCKLVSYSAMISKAL